MKKQPIDPINLLLIVMGFWLIMLSIYDRVVVVEDTHDKALTMTDQNCSDDPFGCDYQNRVQEARYARKER